MNAEPVFHSHPRIMGGTPVFLGTRVPAQSRFAYVDGVCCGLDEFLDDDPGVSRAQAVAVLEQAPAALPRDVPQANTDE